MFLEDVILSRRNDNYTGITACLAGRGPVLLSKSGVGHKMHYSVSKIISISLVFRYSVEA